METSLAIFIAVKDLLNKHNCVIVPSFGGFVAQYKPSYIDDNTRTIYPASKQIGFNALLKNNDGILINKIAINKNIDYEKASEIVKNEVIILNQYLNLNPVIKVEGLGSFAIDFNKNLVFNPDKSLNLLADSFGLEPLKIIPKLSDQNNFAVTNKTTKIIYNESVLKPNPNVASKQVSNTLKSNKEVSKKHNRKIGFAYAAISSVLILSLLINVFIFLNKGNLTPLKNKIDELNLGINIITLFDFTKEPVNKIYVNPSKLSTANDLNNNSDSLFLDEEKEMSVELNEVEKTEGINKEVYTDDVVKEPINDNNFEADDLLNESKTKEKVVKKNPFSNDELKESVNLESEIEKALPLNKKKTEISKNKVVTSKLIYNINLAEKNRYYIVVDAFNNETAAKASLIKLIELGYENAEIVLNNEAKLNSLNFLVSCKKFNSKSDCTEDLNNVKAKINPTAFIYSFRQ